MLLWKGFGLKWLFPLLGLGAFFWYVATQGADGDRLISAAEAPPWGSNPAMTGQRVLDAPKHKTTGSASLQVGVQRPGAAPSTFGYGLFTDTVIWPSSYGPGLYVAPAFGSTEIADVTGDGRSDLVVLGSGMTAEAGTDQQLLVFARMADGSLAAAKRYRVPQDISQFTGTGDFNEDGAQDIVITGLKSFALYASDQRRGFLGTSHAIYDPVELATQTPGMPLDVDQDGHLDLVFFLSRTHAGSSGFPTAVTHSRLVVWFGDGRGGFPRHDSQKTYGTDVYDVEQAISLATGDIDGDGIDDLVMRTTQHDYALQQQRHLLRFFLNDRKGSLKPAFERNATMDVGSNYSSMDYIAIGDFNSDGRNDIAGSPGSMDPRLWILLQSGTRRFDLSPLSRHEEPLGVSLETADLDRNGGQDLVVGHDAWGRIGYYMQSEAQLQQPVVNVYAPETDGRLRLTSVAVGDIIGDDCPDVAIASSFYGLYLMRGQNCAARKVVAMVCRTPRPGTGSFAIPVARPAGQRGMSPALRRDEGPVFRGNAAN